MSLVLAKNPIMPGMEEEYDPDRSGLNYFFYCIAMKYNLWTGEYEVLFFVNLLSIYFMAFVYFFKLIFYLNHYKFPCQ